MLHELIHYDSMRHSIE